MKPPYIREVRYVFEAGERWAITSVSPNRIEFEETRKNGQEDCHMSGHAKLIDERWVGFYSGEPDWVEAYFNEHGPPKAHTVVVDEFVQTIDDTQLERLVCFVYLLTRGTPSSRGMSWGEVKELIRELSDTDASYLYTSKPGEALAREIVGELLTGTRPSDEAILAAFDSGENRNAVDLTRRETFGDDS